MKPQPGAIVLMLVNLMILISLLAYGHPAGAQEVARILRGGGLEIVDEYGRVRAQIILVPASVMPDGKRYPETTLLRLIDTNGRPAVKVGASIEGSAMSMDGNYEQGGWSGVQILAQGTVTIVKLVNKDGHEQLIEP